VSAYSIRLYQEGDAEQMHSAALESVAEVYPWMSWCHERYSLAEARHWVAIQEDLATQGVAYEFAVLDEGGRFLGGCGINQINKANRFANLGYWVRTSAMGRGVAPAAVRLVTEYAARGWRRKSVLYARVFCAVACCCPQGPRMLSCTAC